MHTNTAILLLWVLTLFPTAGFSQSACVATPLTDAQLKALVDRGRAESSDLPAAFPQSRWVVHRQGCHYVLIEYGLPEAPDYNHIFRINQHGVIVDAQTGNELPPQRADGLQPRSNTDKRCPGRELTQEDLAKVVREQRVSRKDLPAPYPQSRVRVDRLRCLYLYFEYAIPERRGEFQVFTIDPMGELLEFSRSQPY